MRYLLLFIKQTLKLHQRFIINQSKIFLLRRPKRGAIFFRVSVFNPLLRPQFNSLLHNCRDSCSLCFLSSAVAIIEMQKPYAQFGTADQLFPFWCLFDVQNASRLLSNRAEMAEQHLMFIHHPTLPFCLSLVWYLEIPSRIFVWKGTRIKIQI